MYTLKKKNFLLFFPTFLSSAMKQTPLKTFKGWMKGTASIWRHCVPAPFSPQHSRRSEATRWNAFPTFHRLLLPTTREGGRGKKKKKKVNQNKSNCSLLSAPRFRFHFMLRHTGAAYSHMKRRGAMHTFGLFLVSRRSVPWRLMIEVLLGKPWMLDLPLKLTKTAPPQRKEAGLLLYTDFEKVLKKIK